MSKAITEVNDASDPRDKEIINNMFKAETPLRVETLASIRKANKESNENPINTLIIFHVELGPDGHHIGTKVKGFTRKFADGHTQKTTPPTKIASGSKKSR
jgi:hypothetical protein